MIGKKLNPMCPNCGGILYCDNDRREDYFTCVSCAREFTLNMMPIRITVKEFIKKHPDEMKV